MFDLFDLSDVKHEAFVEGIRDLNDCVYSSGTVLGVSFMINYKTKEIEIIRENEEGLLYETS